jgi:gluconate 2-dehydrogenase gamma chain
MKSSRKAIDLTRRQFMAASAMAGAALAAGCSGRSRTPWEFLGEEDARTLAAICDQIIPADRFPSASQAGVLTYIDLQLTRHYQRHQRAYLSGLKQADLISLKHLGLHLADASPQQQFAAVTAIEQEDRQFFEMVRSHTLEGYYGSPRHGGNRDAVSWRMLGLAEPPVLGRAQYDFTKGPRS